MHQNRDGDFVKFNEKELTITNLIEIEITTEQFYANSKNNIDLSVVHLMDCQFLYYTLEIPQLDLITTENMNGDNATLIFEIPSDFTDTSVDVTVTAYDEHNLYNTVTKNIAVVQKPLIYPPNILTPTGVIGSNETSILVTLDSYTTFDLDEKQVATDYILYEQVSSLSSEDGDDSSSSSSEGDENKDKNVVADNIFDINNLTRYTFQNLKLSTDKNYCIAARFHSKHYKSEFSFRELTVLDSVITTVSGRKLYRHSSNMGSVLEYTDNQPRKAIILDAAYRTIAQFGTYNIDSDNANYTTSNTSSSWYLNNAVLSAIPTTSIPDTYLNTVWKNSIDTRTGKLNCDTWMSYVDTTDSQSITGCPAVQHCRGISITGIGACELPNIQLLQRIFIEANSIDSLDPTLEDNLAFALGDKNSSGNYWTFSDGVNGSRVAFSSTAYDSTRCRVVSSNGNCGYGYKNSYLGVIPTVEFFV